MQPARGLLCQSHLQGFRSSIASIRVDDGETRSSSGRRRSARANVCPRKACPEQKIDAAVALIMAIARCMAAQPPRSIYETRGLTFISLRG
jgi:hypothetical protein